MNKKTNSNLTSFSDHLDAQYGKTGTKSRDAYEEGFEAFRLGVMIQELRKGQGLTQEQLAENVEQLKHISQELRITQAISGFPH